MREPVRRDPAWPLAIVTPAEAEDPGTGLIRNPSQGDALRDVTPGEARNASGRDGVPGLDPRPG